MKESLFEQRIRHLVEWNMQQHKQAEERKALGLPPVPKKPYPGGS